MSRVEMYDGWVGGIGQEGIQVVYLEIGSLVLRIKKGLSVFIEV